jgi:DNA-directed RNA polymerase specialized sigma24 family protein
MLRTQRRRRHRRGLQRAAHPRHPERPDQHLGQGVGDLEGMTTPTESDERDRVMRIIQARCPELTDADLEALAHADTASIEAVLPDEIGERIMDAIAALEEKLDRLVAAIGDGDADDLTG